MAGVPQLVGTRAEIQTPKSQHTDPGNRFSSTNSLLHSLQKEKLFSKSSLRWLLLCFHMQPLFSGIGTEGRMAKMPTFSSEDVALSELLKLSGRWKEFDLGCCVKDYGRD